MPSAPPSKISFILQFSRSGEARWTGQVQEVEQGAPRRFVYLETLVEELAAHGVHLMHDKPGNRICAQCARFGGYAAEGS
jgi:hypothetical protein